MKLADLSEALRAHKQLHLKVKVVPRSARSEISGFMADGTLKIKIHAPPEKGKANAELRAFLAKAFQVNPKNVAIVSGETSPLKHIRLTL